MTVATARRRADRDKHRIRGTDRLLERGGELTTVLL